VFMLDLRMIHMSSECEYEWYWKISACSTEYEAHTIILNNSIFSASAVHNKSGCSIVTSAVKLPWRPSVSKQNTAYNVFLKSLETRLVYFVIHGRHISMECMWLCVYWRSPNVNFQNKW
jgi:hypothetical protein